MKEIRGIIAEYDQVDQAQQSIALATVYDVKGSSYRRSGARMLIKDDGNWFGGISGGCIEGNALKRANLAMADGKARLVTYDTANDDEASIGVSLGCNGVISVIITPIADSMAYNPIERLRKLVTSREQVTLITVLASEEEELPAGSVLFTDEFGEFQDKYSSLREVDQYIKDILKNGKSRVVEIDKFTLFLEVIEPETRLIVMGGNYDILPVLSIADKLGWQKTIVTNPKRLYPPARKLADELVEVLSDVPIDKHTVAIIMSHDYQADRHSLELALRTDLSYIGLLGPAVRRQDMINDLIAKGLSVDEDRIYGPAGLDIGALQPEEIALSILAEIIAVQRQRKAQSLRARLEPIHERQTDAKAEII